jgi:hypothetical protein
MRRRQHLQEENTSEVKKEPATVSKEMLRWYIISACA